MCYRLPNNLIALVTFVLLFYNILWQSRKKLRSIEKGLKIIIKLHATKFTPEKMLDETKKNKLSYSTKSHALFYFRRSFRVDSFRYSIYVVYAWNRGLSNQIFYFWMRYIPIGDVLYTIDCMRSIHTWIYNIYGY